MASRQPGVERVIYEYTLSFESILMFSARQRNFSARFLAYQAARILLKVTLRYHFEHNTSVSDRKNPWAGFARE